MAREIGVAPCTLSLWLKGKFNSQRIDGPMQKKALELLAAKDAA